MLQPYTPSGQTPFMTPYQTSHSQQTPRYGQTTPSQHLPPTAAPHMSGPFLHPGAVTPSQRTPSYRTLPTQSPMMQPSPHPSPHSRTFGSGGHNREGKWRKRMRLTQHQFKILIFLSYIL